MYNLKIKLLPSDFELAFSLYLRRFILVIIDLCIWFDIDFYSLPTC